MGVRKIVYIIFIAIVLALVTLPDFVESRGGHGRGRSRRRTKSKISKVPRQKKQPKATKKYLYAGLVTIALPNGTYFSGYGD